MLNQLHARTAAQNASNQKDSLINYTYDPSRMNNPPYKTIYQPTSSSPPGASSGSRMPDSTKMNTSRTDPYARSMSTSLKHSQQQTTTVHPSNVDTATRQTGLPIHPTMQHQTNMKEKQERLERVASRIYTHFKSKYPSLIDASGFSSGTIMTCTGR